ncbi:hypothetical protein B0H14DRAFT_2601926 [Mycena olivaceomarginata]|nr:hypothetical protein B0H14DRAFT_2601926 [Mycena olivaceomarginata]
MTSLHCPNSGNIGQVRDVSRDQAPELLEWTRSTEASNQVLLLAQKRLVEAQEEKLLLDHKIRTIEEELARMRFKSKSTLGETETRGQTKATSPRIGSHESPRHISTRIVLDKECNGLGELVPQVEGLQELVNDLEAALGRLRGDIDEVLGLENYTLLHLQAIEAPAECSADRAAPQPGPAVINIAQKFNRMEGLRQGGPGRALRSGVLGSTNPDATRLFDLGSEEQMETGKKLHSEMADCGFERRRAEGRFAIGGEALNSEGSIGTHGKASARRDGRG